MSEMKHTPGPWAYEPTNGAIYFADGDVEPIIAGINQDNTSEEQADADGRLIAAAPDLVAAGSRILNYATLGDILSDASRHPNDVFAIRIGDLRALRDAIAKAEAK